MSFHSWLQNLRSAWAPLWGQRQHRRQGLKRPATHRHCLEILEDRLTPSFAYPVDYPTDEFYQLTGPDCVATGDMASGLTADFNGDGRLDLFTVTFPGTGDYPLGSIFLGRGNGTSVDSG